MAELFMECEEEELEPWQQKAKPIVVDDDDDDEPIFVGEILSSKPANTYILNRVNPTSPRMGMLNGTPKRGFQPAARPATSTLAVQPQPRVGSLSGTSPALQKPPPGGSSPQEAAKPSVGISQPLSRSAPTPSSPSSPLSRNLNMPAVAPSAARPVATVTAQPVALNRAPTSNTSSMGLDFRPSSGAPQCPSGTAAAAAAGLSKRPATSEENNISPKKAKADETGSRSESPVSSSMTSPDETPSLQKGTPPCSAKNGAAFPQACPKCDVHFNLLDLLKNHMKFCCPDLVHTFPGTPATDSTGGAAKVAESDKGKLIMLVNDFYYGKYDGNVQQVHQEQKTHTTFKCSSCMKLLKNNIRFMNHMKHHLELEKQNSESWESHTTCQHCYRQFPTPFQLQCHIESTHTPHESSTICRICELSFDSEQILLQHMKDNHKPGEMPYVCQVCNYRSSSFSDVEKHFRAVHENTKNLLCPFCLKVVKIGAPFMHHYMRHQKKGVHRCTKCRLQFLTCKEKMDHKSLHHRTFRKPVQLEGLPPGTKVTIRASLGSLPPGSASSSPSVSTGASTSQLSSQAKMADAKNHTKLNVNKAKPKPKPLSMQKKQSTRAGNVNNGGCSSSSNSSGIYNKRNNKIANTALNSLRCSEIQKCIECSSDIRTFASHFPAYVRCSLCRYSTSCSKAYVNHMMSFHSARQTKRFWIYKARSEELRGITTVCLNCDFLTDDSGLDKMAAHLNESWTHTCQVIVGNASSENVTAKDLSDRTNDAPLSNEDDVKSQNISRPDLPEGQKGTSAPVSSEMKNSAEETNKDQLHQGDETCLTDKLEEKESHSSQESSSDPAPSKDLIGEGNEDSLGGQMDLIGEGNEDSLGGQMTEVPAAAESVLERSSGLGAQTLSDRDPAGSEVTAPPGIQMGAAECKEDAPPVLEHFSVLGLSACAEDPRETAEEGGGGPGKDAAEGSVGVECKENAPPVLELSSGLGLSACAEDPRETAEDEEEEDEEEEEEEEEEEGRPGKEAAEGSVGVESKEDAPPSVLKQSSSPGLSAHSTDLTVFAGERHTDSHGDGVAESPADEVPKGDVSSVEDSSTLGPSACTEDLGASAEEMGSSKSQVAEGSAALPCGRSVSPSTPELPSSPRLPTCSKDPRETADETKVDSPEREATETSLTVEDVERASAFLATEDSSDVTPHVPLKGSTAAAAAANQAGHVEGHSPAPAAGDGSDSGGQPSSVGCLQEGAGCEDSATVDPVGEGTSTESGGDEPTCQRSEDQQKESDTEEGGLEDRGVNSSEQASGGGKVSFERFLRLRDEPESMSSDVSEQGSVHLEPLTPSEVLEHEATEILQKGGSVASPAKRSGPGAEQAEAAPSQESSPSHREEAAAGGGGQAEEGQEAS